MDIDTVSIIVPIYNVEKYISRCLESLISQTYEKIIIYAIIDGSPDNSVDVVKRYAKDDARIKCIEKENGGYGSVLEYALSVIDTEYFMICDPDDWLELDAVKTLISVAKMNNADIVAGDRYEIINGEKKRRIARANENHEYVKPNILFDGKREVSKMAMLSASPHAKLYRTTCAKGISFPEKVNYTDFLLYMVVLSRSTRGIYINECLSDYLINRPESSSVDLSEKNINSQIIVFKKTIEQLGNKKSIDYIYYKLYEQCRYVYINVLSRTDLKKVQKEIRQLDCIKMLQKKKNAIYKCLRQTKKSKVNLMLFEMLFSDFTRPVVVYFLIKKEKYAQKK